MGVTADFCEGKKSGVVPYLHAASVGVILVSRHHIIM